MSVREPQEVRPPLLSVVGLNRRSARDLVQRILEGGWYPPSRIEVDRKLGEGLVPPHLLAGPRFQGEVFLVLGGDGTFLRAAHHAEGRPLAGVNLGSLGFLSLYSPADLPSLLEAIRERDFAVERRCALDVTLQDHTVPAYNDLVIRSSQPSKLIRVEAVVEKTGEILFDFFADGVIVATPTGSTAYNLSVMGPVVHPSLMAMVITPLAAHTLSARPVILPGTTTVRLHARSKHGENLLVVVDGNRVYPLGPEGFVQASSRPHGLSLVRTSQAPAFFDVLRQKLGWGGRA